VRRASALLALLAACSRGPTPPAPLDTRNEACAHCRMAVSSARFASQLAAPGEEPRFFDDLGCLVSYLREHPQLPKGSVTWVADHRTSAWVAAARAAYARRDSLQTPMGSHLIAHADATSRAQDPDARGTTALSAADVFGAGGPPSVAEERR
jgi:copper chaperone NosL